MNTLDFLKILAEKHNVSQKEAAKILDSFVAAIYESVQSFEENEKLTLTGFGTFGAKQRTTRQGKNPRTGETIDIPAKKVPVFKFSKNFKDVFVS
ncbi:DNA-binding protein HU [Candidatus Phytoplasma australiense]|uniref:DNA-binding protein HU n=2 Tax=Phytoplasma australiense TaxID=59748 RepID=B1VAP4_PHYAS|nr:HU family DNA-binding protein [Candidatus Phytoplasma australiense]AGL90418.1 DNA-binding protein HU [Strawberry lethal yellows phytoplasma (CPA) str. NZSb11]CAM12017.1 DNA-binding protein HU [Candidatus Phytoplasma australiense]